MVSIPRAQRRRFWSAAGMGVLGLALAVTAGLLTRSHEPGAFPLQIVAIVLLFGGAGLMWTVIISRSRNTPHRPATATMAATRPLPTDPTPAALHAPDAAADTSSKMGAAGQKTQWDRRDQPWWWLSYGYPIPFLALLVINDYAGGTTAVQPWLLGVVAVVVVAGSILMVNRLRVRLTAEGIEVRRFRIRVYRWSDITSVEAAPVWDRSAVWLRTTDMVPQAAPEVLPLPRGTHRRAGGDQAVQDAVAAIRARLSTAQ